MQLQKNIVIVGGGAAGFMAAITAAENNPSASVTILERSKDVLQKVKISGGGRCNVTHNCPDARELVKFYPRGSRELLAPFLQFGTKDTVEWFAKRSVKLKTEADGRMFPVSNSSQTIVNCLWHSAQNAGVVVKTGCRVESFKRQNEKWRVDTTNFHIADIDALVIATGSSTAVWDSLHTLGHAVNAPVPSLFTFNIKDERIKDLLGIAVPNAILRVAGAKLQTQGPLLITHWGLSGPAVLKLSAWGAHELAKTKYTFTLHVNWLGNYKTEDILVILLENKTKMAKKQILANPIFDLPARLWQRICFAAAINEDKKWADIDKKTLNALALQLTDTEFKVNGKSTFKEEFVTAGGVVLKEINFKKFESRLFPNLYFAGEVLDIDAITGGFNFQAAWTGGVLVGRAI